MGKKGKIMWRVFLFLLPALHVAAQGFSSITGIITSAETDERLPFVNVFIANTTIGDASDSAGVFLLERVPQGAYQIVFSHIGHELKVIPVQLADYPLVLDVQLDIKPIEGEELEVEAPAPDKWLKMLDEFRHYFIGTSSRAADCIIVNPEVLNFNRDPDTNALLASTDSTLFIQNNALGYDIRVVLDHFRWYGDTGNYVIYPKFSTMDFQNARQQKRYEKERKELFERSFQRFLSYLAKFDIPRTYSVKIYTTNPQPGYKPLEKKDLMLMLKRSNVPGAKRRFETDRSIRVDYKMDNSPSYFKLNYGYIDINEFGNFVPMDGVTFAGAWGEYRLADTLPDDYWPED